MPRLAGIIHPTAFQITDLIQTIHSRIGSEEAFEHYRHKNLEMGIWQSTIGTNERKEIWVLLDGDIHNAEEIRQELHTKGFTFSTSSVEELLVLAYEAWQIDFLNHLEGPFALALFDEKHGSLFLALDRLGQHPIYWTMQSQTFLFSTQIKTLLASGLVPQTSNTESLASYLYFGFVPQDLSIINRVNKLLPRHYLKIDLKRQIMIEQYWSLSHHYDTKQVYSAEEAIHQLGKLMDQAICKSLPGEGLVGSLLQGNLGSSSMTWFMEHHMPRKRLKTYSAFFEDPKQAALTSSIQVAKALDLPHAHRIIAPEDIFQDLPAVVWHLDEPLADLNIMQTWYLAKLASKECSSIYVDLGWEEVFGGSERYFQKTRKHEKPPLAFFFAQLPPLLRDKVILPILGLFSTSYKYNVLRNIDINPEQVSYLRASALFKSKERKKAFPFLYKAFTPEIFTQRFHRFQTNPGIINPSLYYDAKTKLPDSSLYQYERLMAAHKVHFVTPFLNHHLVEFLAKTPESIKFHENQSAAFLKALMHHVCQQCPSFPEKEETFLKAWCQHPEFRALFTKLQKGRLEDEGLISKKWIRQQLAYPYLTPSIFKKLWSILILEIWFRIFITHPIENSPPTCSVQELLAT